MTTLDEALLRGLGARVRAARGARGWSQKRLGEKAGVSTRFLVQLERGEGNASIVRLTHVAEALELSLATLLAGLGTVRDEADRAALRLTRAAPERRPALLARLGEREKISLIGLRGAGKTTIGRAAAARLDCAFVQLDRRVEDRVGMALSELFDVLGPARYRELALEALETVLAEPGPAVVEVGGSLVLEPDAFTLLLERSRVVWLRATPEEHLRRVEAQGDLRPMAGRPDALGELRAILAARAPLYARAHVQVDTVGCALPAAIAEVVRVGGS